MGVKLGKLWRRFVPSGSSADMKPSNPWELKLLMDRAAAGTLSNSIIAERLDVNLNGDDPFVLYKACGDVVDHPDRYTDLLDSQELRYAIALGLNGRNYLNARPRLTRETLRDAAGLPDRGF